MFELFKKNKRAEGGGGAIVGGMVTLGALALITIAVTLIMSFGADVQQDIQDDQTVNSSAYNISRTGLQNTAKISDKTGIVITVAIAAVILTILVGAFAGIFVALRYFS